MILSVVRIAFVLLQRRICRQIGQRQGKQRLVSFERLSVERVSAFIWPQEVPRVEFAETDQVGAAMSFPIKLPGTLLQNPVFGI